MKVLSPAIRHAPPAARHAPSAIRHALAGALVLLLLAACATPPPATQPSIQVESPPAPSAAASAAVPPPAPVIPANAVLAEGKLGEVYGGAFDALVADCFLRFAVEPGASYELLVADGYNNGLNEGMSLASPAKAVGFWLCAEDNFTSYPQAAYLEWDNDSKSSYGFIGLTPDGKPGPVARFTAAGPVVVVHVQRYKASYVGQYLVRLVRK